MGLLATCSVLSRSLQRLLIHPDGDLRPARLIAYAQYQWYALSPGLRRDSGDDCGERVQAYTDG